MNTAIRNVQKKKTFGVVWFYTVVVPMPNSALRIIYCIMLVDWKRVFIVIVIQLIIFFCSARRKKIHILGSWHISKNWLAIIFPSFEIIPLHVFNEIAVIPPHWLEYRTYEFHLMSPPKSIYRRPSSALLMFLRSFFCFFVFVECTVSYFPEADMLRHQCRYGHMNNLCNNIQINIPHKRACAIFTAIRVCSCDKLWAIV